MESIEFPDTKEEIQHFHWVFYNFCYLRCQVHILYLYCAKRNSSKN